MTKEEEVKQLEKELRELIGAHEEEIRREAIKSIVLKYSPVIKNLADR